MTAGARIRTSPRWMVSPDREAVLAIEADSFPDPWSADELRRVLRERNVVGMVVEDGRGRVAGYVVYALRRDSIGLVNLAVAPAFRRLGYASALFAHVAGKLSPAGRTAVEADVSEWNLGAQLFLAARGFVATGTRRDFFGPGHDAYEFAYRLAGAGA